MTTGVAGGGGNGTAEVKGWRNGLLLILPPDAARGGEDDFDAVIEQVHARLDEARARSFWRGAQTTIDCSAREKGVTYDELSALLTRIKGGFGLVPVAAVSPDPATRAAAERLALTVYAEMPVVKKSVPRPPRAADTDAAGAAADAPAGAAVPEPAAEATTAATTSPATETPAAPAVVSGTAAAPANNALYLPQTVRSGQRIVHDGHLIIAGDVNPGAEVLAGGDVLVFGSLRGLAHAGCYGDESARIVATVLRPPQLRIAGLIARAGDEDEPPAARPGRPGGAAAKAAAVPEVARIVDGTIQVLPL